ncbi:MAG: hypothetical protein WAT51_15780, partial [Holophaga sp.]
PCLHRIHFARFTDIPVLAKLAAQVAACRAEGKHRGTGKKMIERLFFNGIDAKPAGSPVGKQHYGTIPIAPHKTEPALARF